jgi:hypothetical protein
MIAQSGEGRAQVVRNIARHLSKIVEQVLDAVEHPVQRDRELVELVPADRHAVACVSGDDRLRGAADRVKPPLQVGPEDHGAPEADDQKAKEGQAEDDDDETLDALQPLAVDCDDNVVARGQVESYRARGIVRPLTGIVKVDRMKPDLGPAGLQRTVDPPPVGSEDRVSIRVEEVDASRIAIASLARAHPRRNIRSGECGLRPSPWSRAGARTSRASPRRGSARGQPGRPHKHRS